MTPILVKDRCPCRESASAVTYVPEGYVFPEDFVIDLQHHFDDEDDEEVVEEEAELDEGEDEDV